MMITQEIILSNERFNRELRLQIEGTLEPGHIYNLGRPGTILEGTGFPDDYIELSSSHLRSKSLDTNHPFRLDDVRNLVVAINDPIAVFKYGKVYKAQNVITETERDGKKFLVGILFNQERRGCVVSDVRGLFHKDNAEWLNWISQGKLLYVNKEKTQTLIAEQRISLAEVSYLDLDFVAKIIDNFENPKHLDEKMARISDLKVIKWNDGDYWLRCRIDKKPMMMVKIDTEDMLSLIDRDVSKEELALRYFSKELEAQPKRSNGVRR